MRFLLCPIVFFCLFVLVLVFCLVFFLYFLHISQPCAVRSSLKVLKGAYRAPTQWSIALNGNSHFNICLSLIFFYLSFSLKVSLLIVHPNTFPQMSLSNSFYLTASQSYTSSITRTANGEIWSPYSKEVPNSSMTYILRCERKRKGKS